MLFGFAFSLGRCWLQNQSSSFAQGTVLFFLSSLLFPLTSVTFKFLVVYLEDGSFVVFTIFNRSILQSVSIFLRHRVLPAVVEDTLEAHTYGSRLAAVAESKLISAATKRWDY